MKNQTKPHYSSPFVPQDTKRINIIVTEISLDVHVGGSIIHSHQAMDTAQRPQRIETSVARPVGTKQATGRDGTDTCCAVDPTHW